MFGGGMSSFSNPGSGFAGSPNAAQMGSSGIVSPNSSAFGMSGVSSVGGGSPIFQSPAGNKFPAAGGAVVFSPQAQPTAPGIMANPVSPYSYVGGTASSFAQSPPGMGGPGGGYVSPLYSSTAISHSPHHPLPTSPVMHGYGQPTQYSNAQSYGYGSRGITGQSQGAYGYHHQGHYQQQHNYSYQGHHSPRGDEIVEPMHCSPVGQLHPNTLTGPHQYQHLNRNPNSPPRPQYLPAFLTGVDAVAAVQPRPRRMFERSPSTSPPVVGAGGRSPQPKSPGWGQQDGVSVQPSGAGFSASDAQNMTAAGAYNKRIQGRQLRFTECLSTQNGEVSEEKEKKKRSGPPIIGFGASEDIANFLNSPLLKDNAIIVPGAAIAQEAILKYQRESILRAGGTTATADSNWITVFGFPPAAASFIYTNFAHHGSIVQSKSNPGGNWLHIEYRSRIDARKALACNGKILGGTIMVGVITSPQEVVDTYGNRRSRDEPQSNPEPSSGSRSLQSLSAKPPLQERNSESSTDASKRGIRPLAGSQFTSPVMGLTGSGGERSFMTSFDNANTSALSPGGSENVPLPTPSSGLLTKAMEYMFGW